MKKITVWQSVDKNFENPKHNHIEENWIEGDYPEPIKPEFSNQEAWRNMNWTKKFAFLNEANMIIDKE